MAVSRTQEQLCGSHFTRHSIPLSRYASALLRRAGSQPCCAFMNRHRSLLEVSAAEHHSLKRRASAPRHQQRLMGRDSSDNGLPAAAELTAAIRACSSPAQLLDLYRLRGPEFTAPHAHIALNRLVDVTAPPPSVGLDPNPGGDADQDRQRAQEQPGASHCTPQLTGRLRVHQGQEVAQPPLHGDCDQDAERRESNYGASSSEPCLNPSSRGTHSQLKPLVPQAGKRRAAPSQAAEQHSQQQWQDGEKRSAAGHAHECPDVSKSTGQVMMYQPQPPRRMVVSMVSGLVRILLYACHKMDGRDVAETGRALSRLRYQDLSLLSRLEQRALKLIQVGSRTRGPQAVIGREPTGRRQRTLQSSSGGSNGLATDSTAAARGSDQKQLQQQDKPLATQRQQRQQQDADASRTGMDADELFTLITAFGAMGHRPSAAWLSAITQATEPHLSAYAASPRGRLPLLISSLGAFGATPPPRWLRAACAAMQPPLAACSPAQLRALLAGLASMQHTPGDAWMADYLAASERQLEDYSPWELVSTVASLASLRCSPGEQWLERFYACAAALVGTTGGLTGRLAAVLLSSLSQLQCKPAGEWLTLLLLGTRRSLGEATAEELTDVLAALARLRFRPPEPWLQQYFTASFQRLPFQTAEQCCATAVALSKLGRKPQALWLEELARHMGSKLALMPAGQQSSALAALVELGYTPSALWLEAYEKQSNAKLAENSAEELCRALAALGKVDFRPQASWLYAFIMAAYSKLDSFDSTQLALIFDRLPALAPHGSWLDEIIQICAAEIAMRTAQPHSTQQLEPQAMVVPVSGREQQQQEPVEAALQPQLSTADQAQAPAGKGNVVDAAVSGMVVSCHASAPLLESKAPVAAVGDLTSWDSVAQEPKLLGLLAPDAAGLSMIPGDVLAVGGSSGSESASAANSSEQLVQDAQAWVNLEELGAADVDVPAPAVLNGTIRISPELIPAVGGVLSVAAPCGPLLGGAQAGVGMGMDLLGGDAGMDMVADLWAANGIANRVASDPLLGLPEVEQLLVDPGTAAAVALTAASATSFNAQSNSNGGSSSGSSDNGSTNGSIGGSRVSSRSRRPGDDPGGGGSDGGAPGGGWTDDLFADTRDPSPVGSGAASGSSGGGAGRTPDVGLMQRPRNSRTPAAAVPASSSSSTSSSSTPDILLAAADSAAGSETTRVAAQPAAALDSGRGEPQLGSDLGQVLVNQVVAGPSIATVTVTLQPKPRPSVAPQANATATIAPGAAVALAAATEGPAVGVVMGANAAAGGATGANAAKARSRPVLPFGAAAAMQDAQVATTTGSGSTAQAGAGPAAAVAAAETATALSMTTTTAATVAADDGRVQYLDSDSLFRLIGAPDGPPGPDFSSCQKHAREVRAARRNAGGTGAFQLGRIWTNDGSGVGGGVDAVTGPIPSPSG